MDSEKRKAYWQAYYQKNKARILERQKAYNQDHSAQASQRSKDWREKNPEAYAKTQLRFWKKRAGT